MNISKTTKVILAFPTSGKSELLKRDLFKFADQDDLERVAFSTTEFTDKVKAQFRKDQRAARFSRPLVQKMLALSLQVLAADKILLSNRPDLVRLMDLDYKKELLVVIRDPKDIVLESLRRDGMPFASLEEFQK